MKLAASAAFLGEKLKGTLIGETVELGEVSRWCRAIQSAYPFNERIDHLIDMIEKTRRMSR